MKRLIVVYNPRSSRYADVKKDVLTKVRKLKGYLVGKYEVAPTDVDQNAVKLAKLLKDGDLVLAAGGDATASIAANGILRSNKDATLAVLPYGNFNDLSRTLGTKTLEDIVKDKAMEGLSEESVGGYDRDRRSATPVTTGWRDSVSDESPSKLYPLEIYLNGKFFRYATCYVTVGMTAAAVRIYDDPALRRKLKTGVGRSLGSYTSLAGWYFKHRRQTFLSDFKLNGKPQPAKTSDYAAVNGRFMARVMRGREDYRKPKTFRSETDRLTNPWRLFKLMLKSIFHRVPGSDTKGDLLEFAKPSTVDIQAEGEYRTFKNVKTIEIKKGTKCLKVIEN